MNFIKSFIRFFLIIPLLLIQGCGDNDSDPKNAKLSSSEADKSTVESTVASVSSNWECISNANFDKPAAFCLTLITMSKLNADQADSIAYATIINLWKNAADFDMDEHELVDKDSYELIETKFKPYADLGFSYDQEEGNYFLTVDFKKMHQWFHPYVSPAMKSYLEFRSTNKEKISYDAGLLLSPIEMAKRLIEIEKIMKNGNNFTRKLLKDDFVYELSWIYTGMDNTPAFDWETHDYLPEFREAVHYMEGNGGTVIKHFTKTMVVEMEKSKWKYREELSKWINVEAIERKTLATYPIDGK